MSATPEIRELGGGPPSRAAELRQIALIVLIGLLYLALIGRYNAFDLDSRWFPSFSHSFLVEHIETDTFMRKPFPGGMGGVVAFGKVAAIVQGGLLNLFGWSLTAATLISTVFVLLSLFLFARTCRRLGYSANFTFCFIALLGLSEPFVSVSQKARYEFLPVFLLASALWLAARKNVVLSMFVVTLAVEIEPAAIVLPFAIATFLLWSNRQSKDLSSQQLIFRIFLGTIAATGIFFLIHPHIIWFLRSTDWTAFKKGDIRFPAGFVGAYYIVYRRHFPELAALLVAVAVCVAGDKRNLLLQWPALCAAVVLVLATLLRWPNPDYFCFIAPFLCLFLLQVFYVERYRGWILATILLFTLPQYIYRYKLWSRQQLSFSQNDEIEVNAAITRAASVIGKSPDQLNIVGNYALWFAHPHLFVNLHKEVVNQSVLNSADLLLCFDRPLNPAARTTQEITCGDLNPNDSKLVEAMALRGQQLELRFPRHTR